MFSALFLILAILTPSLLTADRYFETYSSQLVDGELVLPFLYSNNVVGAGPSCPGWVRTIRTGYKTVANCTGEYPNICGADGFNSSINCGYVNSSYCMGDEYKITIRCNNQADRILGIDEISLSTDNSGEWWWGETFSTCATSSSLCSNSCHLNGFMIFGDTSPEDITTRWALPTSWMLFVDYPIVFSCATHGFIETTKSPTTSPTPPTQHPSRSPTQLTSAPHCFGLSCGSSSKGGSNPAQSTITFLIVVAFYYFFF